MNISAPSSPVCILGLGLIGGSLLRDLRAADVQAFGWNRSPSKVQEAVDEGFDVSGDLPEVLQRAQTNNAIIVIATPLPAVEAMLDAIQEHAPTCTFTDVVSVKTPVWEQVQARGMQDFYVGGHPMAGTADSGWSAAQQGLFDGAVWVITYDHAEKNGQAPSDEWSDRWVEVARMAFLVGAEVVPSRSRTHDSAVARISHLPHLLAESLSIVGDNGGALALSLAAGSFRDGTRVAGTQPSLVRAMCEGNREALLVALDEALELLTDTRATLAGPERSVQDLAEAGYRSRVRYDVRAGKRENVGLGVTASNRPIIRFRPGEKGWMHHLVQAEEMGARIEIF